MISHVRIQNLRSLVDTGFVEIKPLTILLGSNSSGKSTFLRSFPLLKQSVSKALREPISWFDDAYVDFGDYDTAKSKMAPKGEGIVFSYKLDNVSSSIMNFEFRMLRIFREHGLWEPSDFCNNSTLEVSFQKDKEGIYVNRIKIIKHSLELVFFISDRKSHVNFLVNGVPVMGDEKWEWRFGPNRVILPEYETKRYQDDNSVVRFEFVLIEKIHKYIRKYCSPRLKDKDKIYRLMNMWVDDKSLFLMKIQNYACTSTFKKNVRGWTVSSKEFEDLYNMLAVFNAIAYFSIYDQEIKKMYENCSYIAPMRAAANRYYRTQGLQVRDVDPYGKNLQEFILSLKGKGKGYREKSYMEFTNRVLGLTVTVKDKNGHQQIVLSKDNKDVNLADVGFGYSQIIPIITKFWLSMESHMSSLEHGYFMSDSHQELTVIEQPELHLHPAMQARIADIMMMSLLEMKNQERIFRNNRVHDDTIWEDEFLPYQPSLIVETHSQAMVNRIGKRIREKRFSADDVSILLFEKDVETGKTDIRTVGYNEKGQLTNWPYGFFEPTDDDYDSLFDRQPKE